MGNSGGATHDGCEDGVSGGYGSTALRMDRKSMRGSFVLRLHVDIAWERRLDSIPRHKQQFTIVLILCPDKKKVVDYKYILYTPLSKRITKNKPDKRKEKVEISNNPNPLKITT